MAEKVDERIAREAKRLAEEDYSLIANMVSGVTQYYDFSWETKSGQKICSVLQVTKTTIGGSAVTTRKKQ